MHSHEIGMLAEAEEIPTKKSGIYNEEKLNMITVLSEKMVIRSAHTSEAKPLSYFMHFQQQYKVGECYSRQDEARRRRSVVFFFAKSDYSSSSENTRIVLKREEGVE